MMEENGNIWILEHLEDMILFCKENGLQESRKALLMAHKLTMSEVIIEPNLKKLFEIGGERS